MKTFNQFRKHTSISEDGSPGPSNAVSTGAIAGTGGKGGEPGVQPRKKFTAVIPPLRRRTATPTS